MISRKKTYINTTKDLFYFCISNPLDTMFDNTQKINDIIVDTRNICDNANFRGFTGLRLVVGYTVSYNKFTNSIFFETSTTTKKGKKVLLKCEAKLIDTQFYELKKYLFDTFGSFSDHAIAILAEWDITSMYHVHCTVNEPTNVIYKFAN